MPDTLLNVDLPANQWVNLYAVTSIAVGTAISVENNGDADVYLTVRATEPPVGYRAYNVVNRANGVRLRNTEGDSGAWAFCPNTNGRVNVRVI